MDWQDSEHMTYSVRGPCQGIILKTFSTTMQLTELDWRVELSHRKFVVEEELEVSL
jgi:hypothetical protein